MANEYKGMTERDLLVVVYENVKDLNKKNEAIESRLHQLEIDFLQYKTEMSVRMKIYLALISFIATTFGSIISFLIQHFVK